MVAKLQNMLHFAGIFLHREGGEVDNNDPKLLAKLESLYEIIKIYDPEQVYRWMKPDYFTGNFHDILFSCQMKMCPQ